MSSKKISRISSFSVCLLSFCLSLLFICVAGEIFLRITKKKSTASGVTLTRFDPILGWAPTPDTFMKVQGKIFSVNKAGLRSENVNPERPQILILGDSVAWGLGVSDEDTFAFRFSKLVKNSGYQVSNLAVPSYGLDQTYLRFVENYESWPSIKAVVLVICSGNDLKDTATNVVSRKRKPLFRIRKGELSIEQIKISKWDPQNLLSRSQFVSWLFGRLTRLKMLSEKIAGKVDINEYENLKVVEMLIEKIKKISISQNSQFWIVLVPSRDDFEKPSKDYLWFNDFFHKRHPGNFVEFFKILKENSSHPKENYLDDVHLNEKGHALLTEVLYKQLLPQGLEKAAR